MEVDDVEAGIIILEREINRLKKCIEMLRAAAIKEGFEEIAADHHALESKPEPMSTEHPPAASDDCPPQSFFIKETIVPSDNPRRTSPGSGRSRLDRRSGKIQRKPCRADLIEILTGKTQPLTPFKIKELLREINVRCSEDAIKELLIKYEDGCFVQPEQGRWALIERDNQE